MTSPRFPSSLRSDLPASFVVMLVALPLCLGIALASGAPLISGLLAGVIGGIVVGSLSGSPLGVSGPAAGLIAVVVAAISELGSFDVFLVAVVLAGVIQVGLGFLRAGIIAYYFPSSVIKGMLAGIGLTIVLKQIPHLVGDDNDPVGELSFNQPDGETTISELNHLLDPISPGPLVVSLVAIAILLLWESRWLKGRSFTSILPGPLVAVLAGIGLHELFAGSETMGFGEGHVVDIPVAAGLAGFTSFLTFPDWSGLATFGVWKTAAVLAVIGSVETLLCVEAADRLDPLKRITPANRELKAQGIGNVVAGLVGALPITQVIVRSSANAQSGARTKASAILHGVFLLVSILAIPTIMNRIPLASLAAILLVVGYKLARPAVFMDMYRQGIRQFAPFLVTVVAIVTTDLLIGIGVGIHVAVVLILFESYKLPFQIRERENGEGEGGEVHIRLAQQVTFLNKARVLRTLDTIPPGSTVEIDASRSFFVHPDVVEIIQDFVIGADAKDIRVSVIGLARHEADAEHRDRTPDLEFPPALETSDS